MHCLAEETVVGFIRRELPAERMADVDRHMAGCSDCRELVADAAKSLLDGLSSTDPAAPGARALPHESALLPGQRVGRYVVSERIGSGGMGVLYAAHDPTLSRKVALKLLREDSRGAAHRQAALLREAQAMAQLAHPNVVGIYDAGAFENQVFLAMELVDGRTLKAWLREAPRSYEQILAVFLDAGRGLAAAHEVGIVHRDFKPENVMIGRDGRVKVGDFGLARAFDEDAATVSVSGTEFQAWDAALTLTRTGAVKGTPAYMAPEQLEGGRAEPRSDQFSFCVALYEALFGVRPFEISLDPEQVPPKIADVPRKVEPILSRGLRVAPEVRYPSMDALLADLGAATAKRAPARPKTRALMALAAGVVFAGSLAVLTHGLRTRKETAPPATPTATLASAANPSVGVAPAVSSDPAPSAADPSVAIAPALSSGPAPSAVAAPTAPDRPGKPRTRDKARPPPSAGRPISPASARRPYDDSPIAPSFAQGAR
jgi:serine/threonine protein kinase